jgi:hypothetical protein
LTVYLPYTGLGFEHVPSTESSIINELATLLGENGFTLRSGAYFGASAQFEAGANEAFKSASCANRPLSLRKGGEVSPLKEIYLGYRGFNNHNEDAIYEYSEAHKERMRRFLKTMDLGRSMESIDSPFAQRDAMVRMYQLLGITLKVNSKFMVVWTPDGVGDAEHVTRDTGPTGISIILASHFKIPVLNIGNGKHLTKIKERMLQLKSGEGIKK